MDRFKEWIGWLVFRLFIWSGGKLFPLVYIWKEETIDGRIRVMHFAASERDFNTACRGWVEELDEVKP